MLAALIDRHAVEKNVTKGSHKYQIRYCFSGRIICGECGATFKHRTHQLGGIQYEAWCCSTHIYNKESCSMKFVRDEDLKHSVLRQRSVKDVRNGSEETAT